MERQFQIGDIVRHFKYETLTKEEQARNKYLYCIREFAQHTETGEELVVYQALYSPFKTFARPKDMFVSEVDHKKYPDIKQKYRLEVIGNQADNKKPMTKADLIRSMSDEELAEFLCKIDTDGTEPKSIWLGNFWIDEGEELLKLLQSEAEEVCTNGNT